MKRKTISTGEQIDKVSHIVNADGHYLFCRYWEPKTKPKALVYVVHGYGEHSARYGQLAKYLNEVGFYVFSNDILGHGESEGEGWYYEDTISFVRDTLQHADLMHSKFPDMPIFLFGHSLGGSIAILSAHRRPGFFRGVVVSAGNMSMSPETATPLKMFLLKNAARFFPRMKLGGLKAEWLSRDEAEVQRSIDDPLGPPPGIRAKSALSLYNLIQDVQSILTSIEFPFLVTHGDGDRIASVEGTKQMYELSKSTDKTIQIYPGMYHNLNHEILEDRMRHFNVVRDWILKRTE